LDIDKVRVRHPKDILFVNADTGLCLKSEDREKKGGWGLLFFLATGTCRKESGSESFYYGVIDGGRFGYE
jgi:hypothetical protein